MEKFYHSFNKSDFHKISYWYAKKIISENFFYKIYLERTINNSVWFCANRYKDNNVIQISETVDNIKYALKLIYNFINNTR